MRAYLRRAAGGAVDAITPIPGIPVAAVKHALLGSSTGIGAAECPVTGLAAIYPQGLVVTAVVARALVATAAFPDIAVDMSRAEGLVGRAAVADVWREARILHVSHIIVICILPR
jgi:hypothetical protein